MGGESSLKLTALAMVSVEQLVARLVEPERERTQPQSKWLIKDRLARRASRARKPKMLRRPSLRRMTSELEREVKPKILLLRLEVLHHRWRHKPRVLRQQPRLVKS